VLIWKDEKPKTSIIDYESASRNRKLSNVTAVAQFFFLSGWQSEKIRKILGIEKESVRFSKSGFIAEVRRYKEKQTMESLEKLLSYVNC
jgi:predicted Ser/Thr protein kinase